MYQKVDLMSLERSQRKDGKTLSVLPPPMESSTSLIFSMAPHSDDDTFIGSVEENEGAKG